MKPLKLSELQRIFAASQFQILVDIKGDKYYVRDSSAIGEQITHMYDNVEDDRKCADAK